MSIGVVIVTHFRLGEQFLEALRLIVPEAPEFYAVSIEPAQPLDELAAFIKDYGRRNISVASEILPEDGA